ncbi:MAG: hypothetical protein HRU20_26880 [Pseudomonadales bacterium]|nr:hypothetical protein [Pseudomonadales bacterium]
MKAIDSGDTEAFSEYLPNEPGADAKDFQSAFFATRQVIRNNFWDQWLKLNSIYKGSRQFIDMLNSSRNIVIVTTKDEPTVKALLESHGLDRSVDIYDAKSYEQFGGKSNFIDDYIRSHGIKQALFIDDSAQHLEKCSWVENLDVLQAKWGYVSKKDSSDNKAEVYERIEALLYD